MTHYVMVGRWLSSACLIDLDHARGFGHQPPPQSSRRSPFFPTTSSLKGNSTYLTDSIHIESSLQNEPLSKHIESHTMVCSIVRHVASIGQLRLIGFHQHTICRTLI
jgi:hypothetical protein